MRIFQIVLFILTLNTSLLAVSNETNNHVRVGDVISIMLPGEDTLNKDFQVDKQGRVILPEVGPIFVAGKTEAQMVSSITLSLKTILQDLTNLQVFISKRQLIINIQGYVKQPGEYTLADGDSVQLALYAAGGLRSGAQLNRLQLRRADKVTTFNYKAFLDSGNQSLLPTLQSLDTLFIPASPMVGNIEQEFDPAKLSQAGDAADGKKAIKVFGEVNSPGTFSYKSGTNLVDVLMRAGGVTRYAGVEQIRVISKNQPALFNLKRYLDTGDSSLLPPLEVGSTIFVPKQEEEIKSGSNMVYVMGEVAKPGAFEGKKGATFMDILANAGGPTRFAESRQIRVIKANGAVINFDLSGYTEGTNYMRPPAIAAGDAIFVPEKTDMNEKSWLKIAPSRAVRVLGEVQHPGRIEWSDEMSFLDLLAHVGGPTLRGDTTRIEIVTPDENDKNHVYTFNLDSFISKGKPDSALPTIRAGATIRVHDLPQDPSDNKSQWVRQSSDSSIYVFGQVNAAGRYRFTNDMHFLDILSAADGPTMDADIHNIRITHRDKSYARVSKLNLALYFETGDESLLPKVKTGDTIYIPEKNRIWVDESKESTIRVLGAINKPGRYRFNDSMTLLDLLAEAGGPSDVAYLEKISVVNHALDEGQARTFDLVKFSRTADFRSIPVLRAGDTVYIPNKDESTMEQVRVVMKDVFQVVATIALIGAL
ncbi:MULTISPECIES: SLBB domain-containing protein [Aliivibrio]|uniref:Sugar ABC transporter substrate-binding protein n=1 Tax=Aliivibrio finisterrensis TaxID=511998 RepID=A0A4Q5KTW0_9GAMM|nr:MULTISPECIES: SLBB domain-containing protein [Aliivibrio]MDD9179346.1 SLBB domain-containing protein [Aliivibrio sp. A6]RYU51388.1 sugar ABC transporter substrate-binding protein [Aliivibrio finisterrensis]RYU52568.1 sugar ABC transporter substrate-binding protein [Aliivibrio finisterrensis]RYU58098.1 sugar ABC transporter substrate-binding protein [Aliivibrio finisterrensis]RYU64586.1 sugar ABC transporter substrate-binding protein [Aliivibrio finisterrensis]